MKRYEVTVLISFDAQNAGAAEEQAVALMLSADAADGPKGWDLLDVNAEQVDLDEDEAA